MLLPVNRDPTVEQVRSFGRVMFAAFAVLGGLLWYLGVKPEAGWRPEAGWGWQGGFHHLAAVVLWGLAVGIGVICPASHSAGRRIYVVWMTFGMALGTVMTTVLLTVMYFLVLPIFTLIRLKDPLRKRLHREGTYWETHTPHEATLDRTLRPF